MKFSSDSQRKAAFSKMSLDGQFDPRRSSIDSGRKVRMSGFSALLAFEGMDNVFSLNPRFKRPRGTGYKFIDADVGKMDDNWKNESGYYVNKGGDGGHEGRYKAAIEFIEDGKDIVMPEVCLNSSRGLSFIDGRHRFAALRDKGIKIIKVAVPEEQAECFKDIFGVE